MEAKETPQAAGPAHFGDALQPGCRGSLAACHHKARQNCMPKASVGAKAGPVASSGPSGLGSWGVEQLQNALASV